MAGYQPIDRMQIVDCLLPGQVRRSGRVSFMGPSISTRSTAEACAMRGGEYVDYDRATIDASTRVWMTQAKAGDAQAQYYLGQIYERGGNEGPAFAQAAEWYGRAADQGHKPSLLALAALYEAGNGVASDETRALSLYREAMGLSSDDLIRVSESNRRVEEERAKIAALESQLRESRAEISDLQTSIEKARQRAASAESRLRVASQQQQQRQAAELELQDAQRAIVEMQQRLDSRQATSETTEREIAVYRSVTSPPRIARSGSEVVAEGTNFGRYFAVVIGAQNYRNYAQLGTPRADAEAVAELLRDRYGFATTILLDPAHNDLIGELVKAINNVGPKDNLLIYYAGHGEREGGSSSRGSWLPVDVGADQTPVLPTEIIADFVGQSQARSVLIIADACFGSPLARSTNVFSSPHVYSREIPSSFLRNRARLVIESGGDRPVRDDGGDGHSIFASALLRTLASNHQILSAAGLLREIKAPVQQKASAMGESQDPVMKVVRSGEGFGGGEFFFVPTG